jgi:hypothetical protein
LRAPNLPAIHLHDLANDRLDGVRIFKNGEDDFFGRVLFFGVAFDEYRSMLLVVETSYLPGRSRLARGVISGDTARFGLFVFLLLYIGVGVKG